jgi:hypothetical protein
MVDRFCTALGCVDVGFSPDGSLDHLPLPSQIGATRVGGIDLYRPRMRSALAAVLTLRAAPDGFAIADLTDRVQSMTDGPRPTTPSAAYDLRSSGARGWWPAAADHGAAACHLTRPGR